MGLVVAATGLAVWYVRAQGRVPGAWKNPAKRTAIAFGLLCLLVPWGMYLPSEVTFINLRMWGLALGLAIATVDPAWFAGKKAQTALVIFCSFCVVNYGAHAIAFGRESEGALRLVSQVPDNKILTSLVFHNRSSYFAKQFRLSHFLPMYYTVNQKGINTQFWAKYTDHLPIEYRPGKRPEHTPDWTPEKFQESHMLASDYLLMQSASDEDSTDSQRSSRNAVAILQRSATLVACEDLWCLYRLNTKPKQDTIAQDPPKAQDPAKAQDASMSQEPPKASLDASADP
jgi:hypothetical protein